MAFFAAYDFYDLSSFSSWIVSYLNPFLNHYSFKVHPVNLHENLYFVKETTYYKHIKIFKIGFIYLYAMHVRDFKSSFKILFGTIFFK